MRNWPDCRAASPSRRLSVPIWPRPTSRATARPSSRNAICRPVIAGTAVAAIAVTEPGAGSDVAGTSTVARRDEDGYRLHGNKLFITNGGIAERLLGLVGLLQRPVSTVKL